MQNSYIKYAKAWGTPKIIRTFYDNEGREYDVYEAESYILAFNFRVVMKDTNGKLHTLYIKNYYQNNDEEIIKEFKKWVVCV